MRDRADGGVFGIVQREFVQRAIDPFLQALETSYIDPADIVTYHPFYGIQPAMPHSDVHAARAKVEELGWDKKAINLVEMVPLSLSHHTPMLKTLKTEERKILFQGVVRYLVMTICGFDCPCTHPNKVLAFCFKLEAASKILMNIASLNLEHVAGWIEEDILQSTDGEESAPTFVAVCSWFMAHQEGKLATERNLAHEAYHSLLYTLQMAGVACSSMPQSKWIKSMQQRQELVDMLKSRRTLFNFVRVPLAFSTSS